MQNDNARAAVLVTAWKMTDHTCNFIDKENYISELRKSFAENYEFIVELSKLDELKTASSADKATGANCSD